MPAITRLADSDRWFGAETGLVLRCGLYSFRDVIGLADCGLVDELGRSKLSYGFMAETEGLTNDLVRFSNPPALSGLVLVRREGAVADFGRLGAEFGLKFLPFLSFLYVLTAVLNEVKDVVDVAGASISAKPTTLPVLSISPAFRSRSIAWGLE